MATIERHYHRGHGGTQGCRGNLRHSFPLCTAVPPVVKFLLVRRRSPSPRAHTLRPLQSLLRNHATCPWKEQPYQFAAGCARRYCPESDGVGGNTVASPPDLLYTAGRSSGREYLDFPIAARPRGSFPVRPSLVRPSLGRLRFLPARPPH